MATTGMAKLDQWCDKRPFIVVTALPPGVHSPHACRPRGFPLRAREHARLHRRGRDADNLRGFVDRLLVMVNEINDLWSEESLASARRSTSRDSFSPWPAR
jgi:hypothetical protein